MTLTWQENIGWGSGSTFQTAASAGMRDDLGLDSDELMLLRGIMEATSQGLRATHTFDLDDYVGGQGRQGQVGPRGMPGLPGAGTDYVPYTYVPSTPSAPPANKPYHPSDTPSSPYSNILILWSQIASAVVYQDSVVDCTGWGKFVNASGSDRQITLWMKYRTYLEGDPDNGTAISDVITETVKAGKEKMIRVRGSFIATEYGYVDLYANIDTLEALMTIEGNHYGISGKGVFSRFA